MTLTEKNYNTRRSSETNHVERVEVRMRTILLGSAIEDFPLPLMQHWYGTKTDPQPTLGAMPQKITGTLESDAKRAVIMIGAWREVPLPSAKRER